MSNLTVNISKTIDAPIEKVFDAWLSKNLLPKFILPSLTMPEPEVTIDARVNGSFTILMHVGEDKVPHTGNYLEINRPHKLVFTWESPVSVDGSLVSIDFKSIGNDKTLLDLTHTKFLNEEMRNNHNGGWSNILDALAKAMTK